ncbi:hypothetical protein EYF80_031151 [Liparis tanakae]|uniref:Uncharacterized protein n=1 Tax=Liparis tanakae TaxID=230148 RepID=A0A4Z2GYG3_9TELE|nr:hypothetical protein EYF80_031151 [Liparis tanakae]
MRRKRDKFIERHLPSDDGGKPESSAILTFYQRKQAESRDKVLIRLAARCVGQYGVFVLLALGHVKHRDLMEVAPAGHRHVHSFRACNGTVVYKLGVQYLLSADTRDSSTPGTAALHPLLPFSSNLTPLSCALLCGRPLLFSFLARRPLPFALRPSPRDLGLALLLPLPFGVSPFYAPLHSFQHICWRVVRVEACAVRRLCVRRKRVCRTARGTRRRTVEDGGVPRVFSGDVPDDDANAGGSGGQTGCHPASWYTGL